MFHKCIIQRTSAHAYVCVGFFCARKIIFIYKILKLEREPNLLMKYYNFKIRVYIYLFFAKLSQILRVTIYDLSGFRILTEKLLEKCSLCNHLVVRKCRQILDNYNIPSLPVISLYRLNPRLRKSRFNFCMPSGKRENQVLRAD